ncbi:MAG: 50S ribosomal protein L4 [Dehalococcoidia bacterium]
MKLPVRNVEGKEMRQVEVDGSVFGTEPNMAVLHQAFVAQRANQRWGTAQTKSRGEVRGSTRKIRMQKYTGRARAGSARSPTRVGGGVAFGPRFRDYSQALPKKMRRLAIRSALSGKVADQQLVVIDRLSIERPKTQEMLRILRNVGIERTDLIVTGQPDRMALASARNLARTKVVPAAYLNVVDLLTHRDVLMTEDAIRVAEELWGQPKAAASPPAESAPKRRRTVKKEKPAPETSVEPEATAEPEPEAKPKRRTRKTSADKGEA